MGFCSWNLPYGLGTGVTVVTPLTDDKPSPEGPTDCPGSRGWGQDPSLSGGAPALPPRASAGSRPHWDPQPLRGQGSPSYPGNLGPQEG